MFKKSTVVGALVLAATLGGSVASAAAAGDPQPGAPNCHGQFMAISNHSSGAYGASGNAKASAGAGYFLGSDTHAVVSAAIADYCSA